MAHETEEISLREVWQLLMLRRRPITILSVVFGSVALVIALILPKQYSATAVLSVIEDPPASGLGGGGALLSQFSGLASLGGFNFGSSSQKAELVATLESAALTEVFIRDNELLPILYSDLWDDVKKDWKSANPKKRPTLWKAERYFSHDIRFIEEDKKSGLIRLTVTWTDPELAASWANKLVAQVNAYLRGKAIEKSNANLAYLNTQLAQSSVELQRAIYSLIESEIKQIMVARGSEEYAFKVIDPARVPEKKSAPKRAFIVLGGVLLGLLIGIAYALARPPKSDTAG